MIKLIKIAWCIFVIYGLIYGLQNYVYLIQITFYLFLKYRNIFPVSFIY
jgi:hypothetical protein